MNKTLEHRARAWADRNFLTDYATDEEKIAAFAAKKGWLAGYRAAERDARKNK